MGYDIGKGAGGAMAGAGTGATIGSAIAPGIGTVIGGVAGFGLGALGGLGGNKAEAQQKLNQQRFAEQMAYLNQLNAMRGDARKELTNAYAKGEEQFLGEANTPLAEIGLMQQDVLAQGTEAQEDNKNRIRAELSAQGVRGGQAGILAGRQIGKLNEGIQRQINEFALADATNRQKSRLGYFQNKAQTPYNSLYNNTQWWLPSATEISANMAAIGGKYQ